MKLKIVANATLNLAINDCCLEVSKNLDQMQAETIVITPENKTLAVEEELLAISEKKCLVGVEITNFSRLIKKYGKATFPFLSRDMGTMILSKIIYEHQNDLVCYKHSCKKIGFASEIYSTILQIKNSRIKSSDFVQISRPSLNRKMQDIFFLYECYENEIKDKFLDEADRILYLIDFVTKSPKFKLANICFTGFDSLTPQGFLLAQKIVENANSVSVFCNKLDENNANINENEILNGFIAIANKLRITPEIESKNSSKNENAHINKNMFGLKRTQMETKKIELWENLTITDEIQNVVNEILLFVRKGNRYNDISICVDDIKKYKNAINFYFVQNEIPVYFDSADCFAEHFLSQYVLQLCELSRKNYCSEDIISFCKNPLVDADDNEKNIFENYCLKFGIEHSLFERSFEKFSEIENVGTEIAEKVRKSIWSAINLFCKIKKDKISVYIDSMIGILKKQNIESKVFEFAEKEKLKFAEKSKMSEQIYQKMIDFLSVFNMLLGEIEVTIDEFYAMLSNGIASLSVHIVPTSVDSVFVGNISSSANRFCKLQFVLGANENAMPTIKYDCGIISDNEINEISGVIQSKIEPTIKAINKREKQKLFEILQNANEKLIVSYAVFCGQNKNSAGLIQKELQTIFTTNGKPLAIKKDINNKVLNINQARQYVFNNIRMQKNNISTSGLQMVANSAFSAIKKYDKAFEDRIQHLINFEHESKIANAKKLFFPVNKTSISQIEDYFACPFRHFARFGLRLRERDIAKMRALDIGNLLHSVLEKFSAVLMKNNFIQFEDKEFSVVIKNILIEVLKEEKYNSEINLFMIESLKNEATRLCYSVMKSFEVTDFKQVGAEVWFGQNSKIPAISFDGVDIKLEGKIDRIDKWKNCVRVIDYKTGKIELSGAAIFHGKKVQLFVYLIALSGVKANEPVGAFYLPIKSTFTKDESDGVLETYRLQGVFENSQEIVFAMDNSLGFDNPNSKVLNIAISTKKENVQSKQIVFKKSNLVVDKSEFLKILEYEKKVIANAIKEMETGNICASPLVKNNEEPCTFCQFAHVCGISKKLKNKREQYTGIELSDVAGVMNI